MPIIKNINIATQKQKVSFVQQILTYLKLKHCVFIYLRISKYIKVEWSAYVLHFLFSPSECAYTQLECIHAWAIVDQLLISILHCVVFMTLVFVSHLETYKRENDGIYLKTQYRRRWNLLMQWSLWWAATWPKSYLWWYP